MSTDLNGHNLTETFSAAGLSVDVIGPYLDSGAAATLTLATADDLVVVNELATNAIDQTGNAITLDIDGPGIVSFAQDDTYTGGTNIDDGLVLIGQAGSLGAGTVTFGGAATLAFTNSFTFANALALDAGLVATIGATAGNSVTLTGSFALNGSGGTTAYQFGSATDTGVIDLATLALPTASQYALAIDGGKLVLGSQEGADIVSNALEYLTVGSGVASATLDLDGETLNAVHDLAGADDGMIIDSGLFSALDVSEDFANSTFAGSITGPISLTVSGLGTLTLTGANTTRGGVNILAGAKLRIGDGGTTGSISDDVTDAGTLTFDLSGASTFGSAISGAGVLVQDGDGTLTLTGANGGFTGTADVGSGVLALGSASALGAANVDFASPNTALLATTSLSLDDEVTWNAGATGTIGAAAGQTLTLGGVLNAGANATIVFGSATATGAVYLDLANAPGAALNAEIVVAGGTLSLPSADFNDTNTFADLNYGLRVGDSQPTTATLDLGGSSISVAALFGDHTGIILDSDLGRVSELAVKNTTVSSNFAGVIENGAGSVGLQLVGTHSATLQLTGANTYSGGTTIDATQTLQIGAGGASGSIVGEVDVASGGVLTFDRSDAYSFAGSISGGGVVSMLGAGTLTLGGANSFTGGLSLDSGTIDLASQSAAGTGEITFESASAELEMESGDITGDTIQGLAAGDSLDFVAVTANATSVNGADQLVLLENGSAVATLQLANGETGLNFITLSNAAGTNVYAAATVAQYFENDLRLGSAAGGFLIVDTAAAISGGLGFLASNSGLQEIVVSDNLALTVTVAEVQADGAAIGLARDADGTPVQLNVLDTTANLVAGLTTLLSDASQISSIVASGGPVTVSSATFVADKAVLDKIDGGFIVSDTSAHISAALSALSGDAAVVKVVSTDNAPIAADVADLTQDAALFAKLRLSDGNPYQLAISDSAANVEAGLATLLGDVAQVSSIATTGGPVTVTAATFVVNQAILDKIAGGFVVADTSAHIAAALAALDADADVASIVETDSAPIAADVADLSGDTPLFAKLGLAAGGAYQLAITDSAANIEAGLATLLGDAKQIASIVATGGPVTVSTAEFLADKGFLDKVNDGFLVSDTSAHVSSALAALNGDANVTSVVSTDSAPITVDVAELTGDGALFAKLRLADGGAYQYAISDSAADIGAGLTTLEADLGRIASIGFTDAGTPALSLTSALAKTFANVLQKIVGNWALETKGVKGSWTTLGHGNGLVIDDIAGTDKITGGGANESFVFGAKFGQATLVDFYKHRKGATHDTITLSKHDFKSFGALLGDVSVAGANLMIEAADHKALLILDGMNVAQLKAAKADFQFV
jgi:autotransporter-associated beta strand protein